MYRYRPYLKTLSIQYHFYPEDGNIAVLRSIFGFLPDYLTRLSRQQYGLFSLIPFIYLYVFLRLYSRFQCAHQCEAFMQKSF